MRQGLLISLMAIISSCGLRGSDSTSEVRVTNGDDAEGEFPEVIRIGTGRGFCSATFVSGNTILTAAHCVSGGVVTYNGQSAAMIYPNPNYQRSGGQVAYDFAVVTFRQNLAPATATVARRPAQAGDQFVIVGYGMNDLIRNSGSGTKRKGTNYVGRADGGVIAFAGDARAASGGPLGTDSASGKGDSGGPLFIGGQLSGVTSGGVVSGTRKYSYYVDLTSRESLNTMRQAAARGAVIPGLDSSPAAPLPQTTPEPTPAGSNSPTYSTQLPTRTPIPARPSGTGATSSILDCNADYTKIRTSGASGVCLNRSSNFCYRYGGGAVQYNQGRVACPGGASMASGAGAVGANYAPASTASGMLDCNRDYARIRQGGSGVCVNATSGSNRCYRYSNGDVQYGQGVVSCN